MVRAPPRSRVANQLVWCCSRLVLLSPTHDKVSFAVKKLLGVAIVLPSWSSPRAPPRCVDGSWVNLCSVLPCLHDSWTKQSPHRLIMYLGEALHMFLSLFHLECHLHHSRPLLSIASPRYLTPLDRCCEAMKDEIHHMKQNSNDQSLFFPSVLRNPIRDSDL
jgi:hypothetical protein